MSKIALQLQCIVVILAITMQTAYSFNNLSDGVVAQFMQIPPEPIVLQSSSDSFDWQQAGEVAIKGAEFLSQLADICADPKSVAYKSMKAIASMVPFGEVALSLVAIFVDIPDPMMEKMNEIQNQINNLQDRMLDEFKNTQKVVNSVDCKGRLSEYKNVIQSAFREVLHHGNEKNPTLKQIYRSTLKESLFQVKTALNYMIASAISQSTNDLNACPILDIIEKGDESTEFIASSDAAVFTMANVMITETIFGATVISMIYELEYGRDNAQAMVTREYGSVLENMQKVINAKIEKWTTHPIEDFEKNAKQIWLQHKTASTYEMAGVFNEQLTAMFPQYHVLVQVQTDLSDSNRQSYENYLAQPCSYISTKNWDSSADKKVILFCFGKDEILSNPDRPSYKSFQNIQSNDTNIIAMQTTFNNLLHHLNTIQEKYSGAFNTPSHIKRDYFQYTNQPFYSLGVRALSLIWSIDSHTQAYASPLGFQEISCNQFTGEFPNSAYYSNCYIGFGDRVLRVVNYNRWTITIMLEINWPLPWEGASEQ